MGDQVDVSSGTAAAVRESSFRCGVDLHTGWVKKAVDFNRIAYANKTKKIRGM